MISAAIIVLFLLALGLLVWRLVASSGTEVNGSWDFRDHENKIDLEVLELLLSREEDDYLRKSLPERSFRSVKRERIVLARKYLKAISRNTGQLIKTAELVRSSGQDREVVQAANELLTMAFRVRLNVPLVHFYLLTEWLFPTLSVPVPMRISTYRDMMSRNILIVQRTELARTTKGTSL